MNAHLCECCAEHGVTARGRYYRRVDTWRGSIGLYLCRAHSLALTLMQLTRGTGEKPITAESLIHVDENGRAFALETH